MSIDFEIRDMLIDTHTHIYAPEYDADRDSVFVAAQQAGIAYLIMPNIDLSTLSLLIETHKTYPDRTAMALGLHPTSVRADYELQLREVQQYIELSGRTIVAIGEIGLDFYWDQTYLQEQKKVFIEQVRWAQELALPVILHVRAALDETVELLMEHFDPLQLRGVFHCFEGEESQLYRILENLPQMMIGINGNVTYKHSKAARLLSQIPLDKMLLETDAPYLAPVPWRGKRNESAYLVHTASYVADQLRIPLESLAQQTTSNAVRLFSLDLAV
jgi:hydrolase, tatD family